MTNLMTWLPLLKQENMHRAISRLSLSFLLIQLFQRAQLALAAGCKFKHQL